MIGTTRVDDAGLVGDLLDHLPVTDRVFHDLRHTQPLVETLVRTIQGALETGRILIVAPNALLPLALKRLGYRVDIWQVPDASLTEELEEHVTRAGTLADLLANPPNEPEYDLIVLPYVLETAPHEPPEVLERLRRLLVMGGRLVVVFRHAGALEHRLMALTGQPPVVDPAIRSSAVSYSWPLTRPVRLFGRDEFRVWCRRGGLRVLHQAFVIDARPAVATNAMSLPAWLAAEAAYAAKWRVPALRSASIAVVETLGNPASTQDDTLTELPRVTVVLRGCDPSRIGAALVRLGAQTYPRQRFDVVVLHPSDVKIEPQGPSAFASLVPCRNPEDLEAANAALIAATGSIVAFTDELSEVTRSWVEVGAREIQGATVAVGGPVSVSAESATPFLVMPGARQLEKDEGWFSTSNAFFRKDVALEAGGIRPPAADTRGASSWATDLAHRLADSGYTTRFDPSLEVSRLFPFIQPGKGRRSWMIEEFERARELPGTVRKWPAMRKQLLAHGLFASRRTMYFDLMLAGLAGAALRRRPALAVLAVPFVLSNRRFLPFWPASLLKPAGRNLRGLLVRHSIWFAGLAVGSVKARRVVL